jgi:hypothetical protein
MAELTQGLTVNCEATEVLADFELARRPAARSSHARALPNEVKLS